MKITILDGNMSQGKSDFSIYLEELLQHLQKEHIVDMYHLQEMNLHYCTGCWSCWLKTPGECAWKDDAGLIFRSYINSDFVIFVSPLMAGFTTSMLKKITDRLIVLLHPYIQIELGESHHSKRYEKYPAIGLILQKETNTDQEDINIINEIYDRLALNIHSTRKFTKFIEHTNFEEILNETSNI
jgi:multimeric flavodoxin WrbA